MDSNIQKKYDDDYLFLTVEMKDLLNTGVGFFGFLPEFFEFFLFMIDFMVEALFLMGCKR